MKKLASERHRKARTPWTQTLLGRSLAGLGALALLASAHAQVQTAGTLFINVDATGLTGGNGTAVNDITNSGSLGGYFEGTGIYVTNSSGVMGLGFPGGSSTSGYLQLKNSIGGSLIPPALGMVGPQATYSIEVWVLNPQVAGDESMIAWGARNTGLNAAFEYGTGGSGGFQHNGTGNDIQWDSLPTGGGGAPLNANWHHLAYTCDGSTQRLYADGLLVNSQAIGTYATATNAGVALGAQWTSAGTAISTSPGYATLVLGRVRVHDNVLTDAQILNNYNYEKASFVTPVTPVYLSGGPVHRYSFSEPATNDATGLTIHDSVGGANGTVQASYSNNLPQLTGRRLVLPGGVQTQIPGYGAPFVALPSGLVSANSTVNGGSGQVSIEVWYKNNSPVYQWCRVFDIGSCGNLAGQLGEQVTGPGNYPPGYVASGYGYLDTFAYATHNGGNADQHQLLWQNKDLLPMYGGNYTATNSAQVNMNVQTLGSVGTDRHLVVTWDEASSQVIAYENGLQVAAITVSTNMLALNDVNVWLGRSMSGSDGSFDGEFDEVRFYNYVLSPGQVAGNYLTGPNTVNTGLQAPTIAAQPQSQTVNQGWPVTFSVDAAGSPALSYQWLRNSSPLPGATGDSYTLPAAAMANNGDQYSCVLSNNTGSPNVLTSSAATLTVTPNVAPPFIVLHETKDANPAASTGSQRDNYDGTVGALFRVGSAGAMVTHLGMYDVFGAYDGGQAGGAGLQRDHLISLYSGDGSTLIASADIPAGTGGYLYQGYRYLALSAPIFLAANSNYLIQADVYNADGDMWGDASPTTSWAPYFVGTNGPTTRGARYGSHGSAVNGNSTVNGIYFAPNLAAFPVGAPVISALETGVTQYVNLSATLSVAADGQAPMTLQWYKVGTPDAPVAGQTSPTLTFSSLAGSDEGNYYAIASNGSGTAQSANIYLRVFADTAVSITQQPTNTSVLQGYSASFYIVAAGTPPIGYQWQRNGSSISGATASVYTVSAAEWTNNGDLYSCVVSNFANGSPQTATSSSATLSVIANQAPVPEVLYPAITGTRDNYNGSVGGTFQIGAAPAVVTHLGFFCMNGTLNYPHEVTLFSGDGNTVLADVTVSGSGDVLTNQYAWVALTNPITLSPNTSYLIAANVYSADGDPWPDVFAPSPWNSYYVGGNAGSTRIARYSNSGVYLPSPPLNGNVADSIYGAPNVALLPVGPPVVLMQQTNATAYVGSNAVFNAFVNGQAPLTVQWYKAPSTLLAGQTTTTLNLNNLTLTDQGNYYLVANNPQGTTQGASATLTVLQAGPPSITQQPQPQTVWLNQTASFSVAVSVPPLSYQWWFNGAAIPNQTNSTLVVAGALQANAGSYQATIANSFGTSTSQVAQLTVLVPASGSYPAAVLNANPLVYYRFSDIAQGTNAFNMGSLGPANDGTYEGLYTNGPGPVPPAFPNFESTNQALVLDGSTVDVSIPALNIDTGTGPNMTLAAWLNSSGAQLSYAGILFYRGPGGASGFGVKQDTTTGNDMLEYHWANNYYQFNSALFVTNYNQWVFAALVVYPDQAILYYDDGTGLQSTNNVAAHAAVPFAGVTYVGWDDNDAPAVTNTRRFAGSIDEPMLFNRSLSANEISTLYHAGIGPVQLQATRSANNLILSWPSGVLQQASQVAGPYVDLSGVTSPYTNTITGTQTYFRVRVP